MNKFDIIKKVLERLTTELVVTNLGAISKLAYWAGDRAENFYMTGSMGLATSISLGLAIGQERKVICFEGDGSMLLNMGSLATIGSINPSNLVIFLLDDKVYQSTGGQKPLSNSKVNWVKLAEANGIKAYECVNYEDLGKIVEETLSIDRCCLVHVVVTESVDKDRIPITPVEIKNRFVENMRKAN
ncbi:MAG: thiamine pyrophosphate-dependent enzyme [Candidatus Thorarchaeota archaeon]